MRREFSVSAVGRSHERRSAGHYKGLTEIGNRARKVSGTQGKTDATTANVVGPTIDCKTVRISAYSSTREQSSQIKGLERG